MKLAPVSADLLIKLALVAAGVGLAYYLYRRAADQLGDIAGTVHDLTANAAEVADAVIEGLNPVNPGNVVNRAASAVGGAIISDTGPGRNADGSWTVGGWLYDMTHDNPVTAKHKSQNEEIVSSAYTGGASGSW